MRTKHSTKLVLLALIVCLSFAVAAPVAAAPSIEDPVAYVNTPRLNVRSGPAVSYSVVVIVDKGQGLSLIGRNTPASWVQVKLPSGITGWVNKSYLTTSANVGSLPVTGDAAATSAGASALVATGRLNMRSSPDPYATVLTILDRGTTVTLIGRNTSGTWVQAKLSNGTIGWLKTAYLRYDILISTLAVTGV